MLKMKKINKKDFLEYIKNQTKDEDIFQYDFTGKNIFFLGNKSKNIENFQIEFISASKKYFYTILLRGITKEAEFLHDLAVDYLRKLNLNRNIFLDTEYTVTQI